MASTAEGQDPPPVANRPPSIMYGPSTPVPLTMTFGELLDYHAEARPDQPAVISHPQNATFSFQQLRTNSRKLAQSMAKAGVKKGDLIAISLGSRIEYFEVFYACAYLGAALVLLNYAYVEKEMLALLGSVKPKMLFAPPGFGYFDYTKLLPKLEKEIPEIEKFVILEDIGKKYEFRHKSFKFASYDSFLNVQNLPPIPKAKLSPHDLVNVQFTSGSTGLPKSVGLSSYNIMNCGRYIWLQTRMKAEDRICLPVPLFHSFGMIVGISTSAVAGSALVLPSEVFSAPKALECIEKYGCTALYGVTTMFIAEMSDKKFATTERSTLKFAIMAGSAMPPELLKRCMKEFPLPRVYTCWGMTELSSFVTMMHECDPEEKKINTAGRLFPHFILKIVKADTGQVLPWGEKGEIVASGYGQMSGYLGNPQKTAETLRQHSEDLHPGGVGGLGDGTVLRKWMHTGDEGYLDPDGYLVMTGRIKDLVIRGGENISPLEIEERLCEHSAIEQTAVIGVPDDKYGETVAAFVELRNGAEKPSDDALRGWVRETLARFKAPQYFFWVGGEDERVPREWPTTTSGKISKPHLRTAIKENEGLLKGAGAKL